MKRRENRDSTTDQNPETLVRSHVEDKLFDGSWVKLHYFRAIIFHNPECVLTVYQPDPLISYLIVLLQ